MPDFNLAITGIGSVPYTGAAEACDIVIKNFEEIPFWPQLPKRTVLENMYAQYAEGLPGFVADEKEKKVYVDTKKDLAGDIENAFQKYLDADMDFFAITTKRAAGFYEFLNRLGSVLKNKKLKYLKAQITGPVSFGLSVTDMEGKSILYYREFEELIPKLLAMKAVFQIRALKKYFDKIILFIDEPYLTSIGSSFVNIDAGKAAVFIDEVASEIKKEGALCGLHCCGNTDWSFILKRDIDILSFDAYNFTREFFLYPEDIKNFLDRGKSIAWGVVPTLPEALSKASEARLAEDFKKAKDSIPDKKKLLRQSLLTPSCGCGTLSVDETKKVFRMLKNTGERLRRELL